MQPCSVQLSQKACVQADGACGWFEVRDSCNQLFTAGTAKEMSNSPAGMKKTQGGAKRGWAVKEKGRHCKTLLLEQIFSSTDAHAEA